MSVSDYNDEADVAEGQLKRISDTMCYAKWAQVSMHLTNGMTHSCYHPPVHKIDISRLKDNPSALHNTDQKKKERKLMLAGERPKGCSYCWKIEDAGERSDRIYRSGESWAQNSRKDIAKTLDTGDINPRYMEVNFNQACNFKCMYCSPHLSSTWEEDIKKFGPYQIEKIDGGITKHNDVEQLETAGFMPLKVANRDNAYVEAFWKWWPQLYKKLELFRITGGEPLMDNNTFKVLDYIYKNPSADLEVSITTNLCPPRPDLLEKFLYKLRKLEEIQVWHDPHRFNPGSGNHWYVNMALKNFSLFVSLDHVGSRAEYIRKGLNFNQLNRNVHKYLDATDNTTLTFINTFSALSVPHFKDFLKYILELRTEYSKEAQGLKYIPVYDPYTEHPDHVIYPKQRILFDVPLLRNPSWQEMRVLPQEFGRYLKDALSFMKANTDTENFAGFYDFEIAKVERNLKIFLDRAEIKIDQHQLNEANFINFYNQYDERNGTNILKVFPELKAFLKSNTPIEIEEEVSSTTRTRKKSVLDL